MSNMQQVKSAYSFDSLEKVRRLFPNEKDLKDLIMKRITQMKKKGFFIDVINHPNSLHLSYLDCIEKTYMSKVEGFKLSDYFKLVKDYIDIYGKSHNFIHVKPNGFEFKYVDFNSMFEVLYKNASGCVYANSFWGIYIENKTLKMNDLVQYDVFKNYFRIAPYNIYDGGNDLLPHSPEFPIGICGRNGAVWSSWQEFVDVRMNIMKYNKQDYEEKLSLLKEKMKNLKSDYKKSQKNYARELAALQKVK